MESSNTCEHNWGYQGLVWHLGRERAGSSARDMVYEDRYFCTKCLEIKDINRRIHGNSYEKVIEGSHPK